MSDAFDQMKNIKNGTYNTEAHTIETKEMETIKYIPQNNSNDGVIKNFILKWGRGIIDFFAWLDVIIAAIVAFIFMAMFIGSLENNPEQSFVLFTCMIFIPLLILLLTIAANYFIYLLIDIRDSLKKMSEK